MDTPTILTLDLHDCPDIAEMHRRIQEAFAFPDYYGKNWNAFWDLIRGTRDNTLVEIRGVSTRVAGAGAAASPVKTAAAVFLDESLLYPPPGAVAGAAGQLPAIRLPLRISPV